MATFRFVVSPQNDGRPTHEVTPVHEEIRELPSHGAAMARKNELRTQFPDGGVVWVIQQ